VYRFVGGMWVFPTELGEDEDQTLDLPRGTLVYGEIVREIQGKRPNQRTTQVFHIIDALSLGGLDIRLQHYTQR
jgi:hypothetical protein